MSWKNQEGQTYGVSPLQIPVGAYSVYLIPAKDRWTVVILIARLDATWPRNWLFDRLVSHDEE